MIIHVRVKPAQRSDQLWRDTDEIVAHIRGVPKDGEANDYLVSFVAKQFQVPKSSVKVIKGFRSKHKVIDINESDETINKSLTDIEKYPQASLFN